MVTMKQIDEARERATQWLEATREFPPTSTAETARFRYAKLAEARDEVERLLREWWDQGCREVGEVEDEVWVRVGKKRYVELTEASAWMQSALTRLVAACGGPASGGNDMVEEVIGLLRVTRGQRDDAEKMVTQLGESLAARKATLNEVFAALTGASPEIGDLATKDLAHAVHRLGAERASAVAAAKTAQRERDDYRHRYNKLSNAVSHLATSLRLTTAHIRDNAGGWFNSPFIQRLHGRIVHALRKFSDETNTEWGNGPAIPRDLIEEAAAEAEKKPDLKPVAQEFLGDYTLKDVEITRRIIARADHLLTPHKCACGLHDLPTVGYVDDDLGHHKSKRCNLTFLKNAKGLPWPYLVVKREGTPAAPAILRCRDCHDWQATIPGAGLDDPTIPAKCRLYGRRQAGEGKACPHFHQREG